MAIRIVKNMVRSRAMAKIIHVQTQQIVATTIIAIDVINTEMHAIMQKER